MVCMAARLRLQVRHVRCRLLWHRRTMLRLRRRFACVLSFPRCPSSWNHRDHSLFLLGWYIRFAEVHRCPVLHGRIAASSAAASGSRLLVMIPFLDTVSKSPLGRDQGHVCQDVRDMFVVDRCWSLSNALSNAAAGPGYTGQLVWHFVSLTRPSSDECSQARKS